MAIKCNVLSVDYGTTHTKTIVCGPRGNILAQRKFKSPVIEVPQGFHENGEKKDPFLEQNMAVSCKAGLSAIRSIMK